MFVSRLEQMAKDAKGIFRTITINGKKGYFLKPALQIDESKRKYWVADNEEELQRMLDAATMISSLTSRLAPLARVVTEPASDASVPTAKQSGCLGSFGS